MPIVSSRSYCTSSDRALLASIVEGKIYVRLRSGQLAGQLAAFAADDATHEGRQDRQLLGHATSWAQPDHIVSRSDVWHDSADGCRWDTRFSEA